MSVIAENLDEEKLIENEADDIAGKISGILINAFKAKGIST